MSVIPSISAPAWVSFMTGKNPGKHGIFDFVTYSENTYFENEKHPLVSSHNIKDKTLWEIFSEKGKKVGVINVPITYPPRKVNGFLISGYLTPPSAETYTYPKELKEAIKNYKVEISQLNDVCKLGKNFPIKRLIEMKSDEVLKELYEVTEIRAATTVRLMEEWDIDFLAVVFRGTDNIQHYFWDKKDILLEYYKKIDEIVGRIINQAGKNVNIFIISDHGFGIEPKKLFFINM